MKIVAIDLSVTARATFFCWSKRLTQRSYVYTLCLSPTLYITSLGTSLFYVPVVGFAFTKFNKRLPSWLEGMYLFQTDVSRCHEVSSDRSIATNIVLWDGLFWFKRSETFLGIWCSAVMVEYRFMNPCWFGDQCSPLPCLKLLFLEFWKSVKRGILTGSGGTHVLHT